MAVKFKPVMIRGKWRHGYALDYHTVSSKIIGYDEYGHPVYDTKRTEIGELLYRLKYQSDNTAITILVSIAADFLSKWNPKIDIIVPIPPSRPRSKQPVALICQMLSKRTGIPCIANCIKKSRQMPELKNIYRLRPKDQIAGWRA